MSCPMAQTSKSLQKNSAEKGYFIYVHEIVITHFSLRGYYRVKPLSDKCRELTAKYVYGLSYVNYNVLVTNWNSNNVEDILMPCMFEDIHRGKFKGRKLENTCGHIRKNNDYIFSSINRTVAGKMRL